MVMDVLQKPASLYDAFSRKPGTDPYTTHYCPGCGHGVVHKLVAEAMDDLKIQDRTIFVSPVGCSVFGYYYFHCGNIQVPHGRGPAVATGIKRAQPDSIVISYQGDGDLAAIGGNNILHAANRGEKITVIFVNNAIYGMTGSQMAPTTLVGQKTTTTPSGRSVENEGYPLRMSELLATLEAPVYIERVAITDAKHVMKARKAIRKALQNQIDGRGFSFVEILSSCPTGWKMTPVEAKKWVEGPLMDYFKLSLLRDRNDSKISSVDHLAASKPRAQTDEMISRTDHEREALFALPPTPERYLNPRIKVAGFGGQGVLLLGQLLAHSAMLSGYRSTWLPSYGPEMRGGTANCHVIISQESIGSPLVAQSDVLIAMNLPSLDKFEAEVAPGGLIMLNSSLIKRKVKRTDLDMIQVPVTDMADQLQEPRVANVIMLGAYMGYTNLLSEACLDAGIRSLVKRPEFLSLNKTALLTGLAFAQTQRASRANSSEATS